MDNGVSIEVLLVTLEAETQAKGILKTIVTLKKDIKHLWIPLWSRTSSTDVEASASIPLPDLTQDNLPQMGEPEMVILRNTTTPAPNITLNRHNKVTRRHLYIAAVFGGAVQMGVLIYFRLITCYYPSKFKKEDKAVLSYAFPFSAAGTVLLVTGIFVCAHVVDRSTNEVRYEPTQGYEVKMVWLQSKQTVSDQVFKSFALYPEECPQIITTSQRQGPAKKGKGKGESTTQREEVSPFNLSVFGTGISLAGFFVQFIGLRAMHWSASVAQLTAILIMTAIRAFIRRGFTASIRNVSLKEGFELDGLAMALGHKDLRSDSGSDDKDPMFDFGLSKGGSWTVIMNEADTPEDSLYTWCQQSNTDTPRTRTRSRGVRTPPTGSSMGRINNIAQNILSLRTKLAQLSDWRGPASTEATQLAEAIEVTMDSLFLKEGPFLFSWTIKVKVSDDKGLDKVFPVVLELRRNEGHWKCRVDELDSILSLWLCSVDKQRQSSTVKLGGSTPKSATPMENDTWFRKKSSETRGGLILIGQQTEDLTQHLKWWISTDWSARFSIENYESLANWDSWRVVGTKGTDYPESESAAKPLENSRSDDPPYALLRHLFDSDNHLSDESHYDSFERNSTFIAIQSHESLERLYAQHIFYAFVWEAVKKTDGAFRFGELDCVIEMMSGKAKKQERLLNWAAAAKYYEQLFLLSVNFGLDSYIYNKSMALMVEYIRAIYDLLQTVLPKYKERTLFIAAKEAVDSLSSLLEQKAGFQVLNALRNLYSLQSKQRRVWSNSKAFPKAQQHSPNHEGIARLLIQNGADVNARNYASETPIMIAARAGSVKVVDLLLKNMEKVWFKLGQTDYPPPPEDTILRGDGDDSAAPLCLGHIIRNLKDLDFPLNQHSIAAFPHRMRVFCNTTLNFTWDETKLKSPGTNLAAGAPILAAAGITAKTSLQFAFMRTVESYEAYERLDTYIVQPTKSYIEDCLAQEKLKAHIKGKVAWSIFMITGIKVARAGKREAQEQKCLAADIGPEMDLPLVATIAATATTHRIASQKTSGEHPGDFVWAIRVAKISRGFLMKDWTIAPYSTRATWSTAAEDEVDVESVLRGEGLEGFQVVEDEEADEAVVFDEDMTD
ncbi:hypothetical protein KAF25_009219 [Fusarium avenaceum]|uniref:Ankyrin repeat protein n=1 Tax=Fusarium avenaceum TaxID=40199 RepID=A0A9P7GQA3_9HYPO|nr:hypothetical protein KAF25_009219 [Fusarium avenaceum]